jgi:hypothetical protein
MNVTCKWAVDKPSNASFTTPVLATAGRQGWLEIFLPHTSDPEGTLSFLGGLSPNQSTHDVLELDPDQVFVEGESLNDTAVTGLTHTAGGTLTVAATLAADVRIRIPVINPPPFISFVYTRSGGGAAGQLIQVTWSFLEEEY